MCFTEATCISHTIENFLLHGSNFKKILSFCSCLDVFSKWFVMYMSLWLFKVIYTSFAHSVTKLKIVLLIKNTCTYVPRLAFFDIKKSHLGFDSTFLMSWKKTISQSLHFYTWIRFVRQIAILKLKYWAWFWSNLVNKKKL